MRRPHSLARFAWFAAPNSDRLAAKLWLLLLLCAACSDPPSGDGSDTSKAPGEPSASAPPSVLLITIDTLRADHLGAYAAESSTTPHLDRLAEQGTVFDRAATPMPMTRPAHFSILTSRYPREHGVLNNQLSLAESATTLAEIFQNVGYHTGGFVAVALLSREAGAAQGFDEFSSPSNPKHRSGKAVVKQAMRFMAASEDPFFLWVHLFDPHLPYAPPAVFRPDLVPRLASSLPEVSWKRLKAIATENDGDIPLAVLNHAKALYRGEVSYVDHWVGELLEAFDRARTASDSIVVFTADHGECFEHGVYFEHADCLYQGAVRIPLLIRHSDFPAGTRFGGQVSSIDVAPTILRSARMEIPMEFSGRPLQDQREGEDRYVLLQHPFYQQRAAGGRTLRQETIRSVAGEATRQIVVDEERVGIVGRAWKLIKEGATTELYSLEARGGEESRETRIDSETDSDVTQALSTTLQTQLENHPLSLIDPGRINDELRETLRVLGYLGEPAEPAELGEPDVPDVPDKPGDADGQEASSPADP